MKKIFFIIFLLIPSISYSETAKPKKDLGDFHVFTSALEARGIDYFSINWQEVNYACEFYKDDGDAEYNKCRLEKAEQNRNFLSDLKTCDQKAFNYYPDALKLGTEEHIIKETIDGKEREIKILKKMGEDELVQRRKAYYISCMSSFGWRDANNWRSGSR